MSREGQGNRPRSDSHAHRWRQRNQRKRAQQGGHRTGWDSSRTRDLPMTRRAFIRSSEKIAPLPQ